MAAIPPRPEQEIINRMYASYEKKEAENKPGIYLGRLGSSFIGEECIRQIWFDWRGFAREGFGGRMLRLFETGHQQEDRIVKNLRDAGFEVWAVDSEGRQFEAVDETGHFITKVDGVIKNVPGSEDKPHILEIKTHNKNSFAGIVKKGIKESKPMHYAQVQISMALKKQDRALYVALCKDDEQFYVERVKEDKAEQAKLQKKIISLVDARMRPAGISDDASSFGCKFCSMKAVCLKEEPPIKTCRSCNMSRPAENGTWVCDLTGNELTQLQQQAACSEYEAL